MNMNMISNQMPEKDMLNIALADLRRSAREYTTATTESSCPSVRQMFTQLTESTMKLQGELYELMSSANMYNAPARAQRQEVSQHVQSAQQTMSKAQQFVQQHLSAGSTQAPMAGEQGNIHFS